MKALIVSAALILTASGTALAAEPNATFVSAKSQALVSDCLTNESSSRSVRACTTLLRAAGPDSDVKARLYAQRAVHKLAMGRFDEAEVDFNRARDLSDDSAIETLAMAFANEKTRRLASLQN